MRAFFQFPVLVMLLALTLSTSSWGAINRDLLKTVDEKQATAVKLINSVSSFANDRFSNENDKEDAQFAYNGFMARFESLREDREALERKEIMPDNATLEKYSKQYDRLISDLNAYLSSSDTL